MNLNALRKQYDKLGDLERLRAYVAARVRDDDQEARTLASTCGHKYTMTALSLQSEALSTIGLAAVGDLLSAGVILAWSLCREWIDTRDDETAAANWERTKAAAADVLALWSALDLLYERLGIDPAQARGEFVPTSAAVDLVLYLAELTTGADDESLEYVIRRNTAEDAAADLLAEHRARVDAQRQERAQEAADRLYKLWEKLAG